MSGARSTPAGGDSRALDAGAVGEHLRSLEAGAVVFEAGDSAHSIYFIRSGEVELAHRGAAGSRRLARLGPGEFFGEQGALLDGPRRSRATVTRESELLELDAEVFQEMCLERPDIGLRISRVLAARAQALEQRLASLEGEDGLRATVRVLLRLAGTEGENARIETTLRSLAEEAGLELLDAHYAIQQLVERRMLRLVEDVLILPDPSAMAEALGGEASHR
jgi:CRP-like cAMP-binding protein